MKPESNSSNDFSISTSGLAEGLQRSASALTTSGNSLEESIGLITAANQVVQNPENVGAAMKIISLRLAGQKQQIEDMGEDTEGMVTTVSKLRAGIMNATKVASNGMKGVDIEDANGNLKNTYTILQDISDIWQEIGEQDKLNGTNQQNYLLETMAGKNRSNVLASLLQSPDVLRNAYEEAIDSQGSALIENEKYLESIEGHMSRLKNEASQFAYHMLSSDGIKGIIDLGTQLLKLVNNLASAFGGLSTLGTIGGGIFGFKHLKNVIAEARGVAAVTGEVTRIQGLLRGSTNATEAGRIISSSVQAGAFTPDQIRTMTSGMEQSARNATLLNQGITQVGEAADTAGAQTASFGQVLRTSISGANLIPTLATVATLVISIGSAIYNAYQNYKKARIENAAELAGQFKDTVEDVDSQIERYTKLSDSLNNNNVTEQEAARIKSELLGIQEQLGESYGKQAQGIDIVNGSLDEQIEKLEEIKSKKAGQLLAQAGAKGSSKGDYKYAYEEMTKERTSVLSTTGKEGYMTPFDIFHGNGIPQILEWAQQYASKGLKIDKSGPFSNSYLSVTGTAEQILSLLEEMGDNLSNIPDYENIKNSGNYKILEDWVNNAYKYYSGIISENQESFMQYLNMKILDDDTHRISYSYKGQSYQNGDLGAFYFRYQQAAEDYQNALKGTDDEAKEKARESFEAMGQAWANKVEEMRKAGDSALDDYSIVIDKITDSVDSRAYDLAQNYKAQKQTPFRHWANKITDSKISKTQFEGAAKTQGIQQGEYYTNRVLQEALAAGFITDIKDSSQIDWLITQLQELGVFAESAAKSGKKAQGTYASFLDTIAGGADDKTFSELIDNVQSTTSSLDGWIEKLQKGEVDSAGLTDLFQEFPDLASNMQFVQAVTDNMNADGFVNYTSDMKQAMSDLNFKSALNDIQKMNQELSDPDSYTESARAAIRAQRDILISQLDLSDVSARAVSKQLHGAQFKQEDANKIKQLLTQTVFNGQEGAQVVARLLLDDQSATWSYEQWKRNIQSETVEVKLEAPVKEFKKSIEATQSMVDKNAKITSFEESLDSGKAKAEDLLSLISTYPAEFEAISSTVSDVLSSENLDGTINGAEQLSDVLSHIKVTNLESSLANAEDDIQRIIAYSQADLSGISKEDAVSLISSDERGYDIAGQTKEDLVALAQSGSEAERQAAVLALGMQISFTDALQIVEDRIEKTAVGAVKSFDSMADSIKSFREKAASDSVTSDDVLGLVETFPELLQYTDVLGQAFSDLTLNGVLNDASQLEQILTTIAKNRLVDVLEKNGITDQSVIQGMANQIDFSSISEVQAQNYKNYLQGRYGVDLGQYDVGTREGRDILGRVMFVVDNSTLPNVEQAVEDSSAQGASNGLKKAMSDVKALDSAFSTLDGYAEKALSGTLAASDLDSIYDTFGDLITDGDQLNALYSSLNMDNFVSDAETATSLINGLKISKLQKFMEKQEGSDALTKATQRAMINQTRFTGVTEDQAREAMKSMAGKPYVVQEELNKLFDQGQYSAIVRLSLYPEVQNREEFYSNIKAAVEGYVKDVEESLKVGIEAVSNIGSANSSIDDFSEKLKNGEATAEDLLSLMKETPKLAEDATDELSALLDNKKADGTLKNLTGVDETLAHMKYQNLEKGIDNIAELNDLTGDSYDLLRKSAFATADLSGISATDADEIVKTYADSDQKLHDMANSTNQLEREAAAVAAGMGISFEQAFTVVETRAEKAKITAVQSFRSMGDEISQFAEKAEGKQVTSEDVLGLVETFPELLSQTDVLSDAFSQLTLDGVVSDASTLQALLEQISRIRLTDLLQANGIRDQGIVQGLANTLDFSHTDKAAADEMKRQLIQAGYDMSGVDTNTEEGLDIMGHIMFVWNNSDVKNLGDVVDNAISNGANKAINKSLQNVQNLAGDMSTLSGMSESVMSGAFTVDDVASLEENFAELQLSGEQLNAIYSSINMDGLVEDATTANALINQLKASRLQDFFANNQNLSNTAKTALLSSTRLTGITKQQGIEAYNQLEERFKNGDNINIQRARRLLDAGDYDALVRLNIIPEYNTGSDFFEAVRAAIGASDKDETLEFSMNLQVLTNLSSKDDGIKDYMDQVASGEATVDGLISLLEEVPQIALNSGDAIAKAISSADFNGVVTDIDALQEASNNFKLENLNEQLDQVSKVTKNKDLRKALKDYLIDSTDLSGFSYADLPQEAKATLEGNADYRKGEFSAEAIMKVFLKGEIDDSDVMQKLADEETKIRRNQLIADVNARINFNSDMSSINGVFDEIKTGDITVDSILSLAQSMPEILEEAAQLGYEFTDMNMDGILDDAESLKAVLSNVEANKLWKFVQNDRASRAGKLTAIANTALGNLTLQEAQKILGENAELVREGLTSPVTREAAVKAKMALDAQGIDEAAANYHEMFQSAMDGYTVDINFRNATEKSQMLIDQMRAATEHATSYSTGQSVTVEDYNLKELEDYKDALDYTADSLQYNYTKVRQLNKAKAEEAKAANKAAMAQKEADYNANADEIERLTSKLATNTFEEGENASSITAHINKLLNDNDIIRDNINHLNLLNAAIDESISKYQQWQNAQSAPESGDMFDSSKEMWQEISDTFDPESDIYQKFGTEKFRSAIEFFAPDNMEFENPQAIKQWQDDVLKQYFTFDGDGKVEGLNLQNFLDKLVENNFAQLGEDGRYKALGEHTMQEIGESLGLNKEFVASMFGEMNEYIWDPESKVKFYDEDNPLTNLPQTAGKAANALHALDGTEVDVDIEGLDKQEAVSKLEGTIDQLQEKKLEWDPQVNAEQIEHANEIITSCVAQLAQLNEPVVMKVDVSQLSEASQADGTAQAVTDLQALYAAQTNKQIQASIGADTTEAQAEIDTLVGKLQENKEAVLKVGIEIDENSTPESILKQLEGQTEQDYTKLGLNLEGEQSKPQVIKATVDLDADEANRKFEALRSEWQKPIETQIRVNNSPESNPNAMPQDTNTATHEQRKSMITSTPSPAPTQQIKQEEITIPVKADVSSAEGDIGSMRAKAEEPVIVPMIVKKTEQIEGGDVQPQNTDGGTVTIHADTSEVKDAERELAKLDSIKIGDKEFNVKGNNLASTLQQMRSLTAITLVDQEFTVTGNGLDVALRQVTSVRDALNQLHDKTVNVTVNRSGGTGGEAGPVLGTAHLVGTALTKAYANGRDFTVGKNETALVNEIGQESRIHNGKWELLPGGPHLQKLDKDDIVFNAAQTQDLIKSGKTARQGTPVSPSAYAKGTANDLVGEEGIEMYVDPHKGVWKTVGETGPEMIDLPKDAVVFNNKQTIDLLNKGYTDTRATIAHVDGTIPDLSLLDDPSTFMSGDAFLSGNAYLGEKGWAIPSQIAKNQKGGGGSNEKSTSNNTDAVDKNTKATNKNTDEKEKEGQVFDWVASRLSYLADQTAKFADAITDFITYEDKLLNLVGGYDAKLKKNYGGGQLEALVAQIAGNRAGAIRYRQEANSVKNPYVNPTTKEQKAANTKFADTKAMIDAGYKIDIQTIKDQKLSKAIQDYQQYADAATQAANNVANLNRSLVELYDTWAKSPAEEAEKQIERLTKGINGLESAEARLDAISKGGSTQAILDSLLNNGKATGKNYSNLGSAGYLATAIDNANKTAYYQKAFEQRTLELDRVLKNFKDFQTKQVQQTASVIQGASSSISQSVSEEGGGRLTRKGVRASGRQVARQYSKNLNKKQKKNLRAGKTVSAKKIKNKQAKAAVQAQNQRVIALRAQTAAQKQGAKIAKQYSKRLNKQQKAALKSGNVVDTTGVKNKKLKKQLNSYNKKAKKAKRAKTRVTTTTTTNRGRGVTDLVTAQDIVGNAQEGLQSFMDALHSAQTDEIQAAAELAAQKVQEIRDNFDYINDAYELQISYQENLNKLNEQFISDAETFGNQVKSTDRDLQEQNLAVLKGLKERQVTSLQKQLADGMRVRSQLGQTEPRIKEGSKEWLEMTQKIQEAQMAAHDYGVQIKQLEIKKLEDITDHYSKIIEYLQTALSLENRFNDRDEAIGNYKKESYYVDNIAKKQEITAKKREEAAKAQYEFWKMSASAENGGDPAFVKGSDAYITKQAEINKLWQDVYDSENEVAKLSAEYIQYEIDGFNRLLEKQDTFISNLNTMAGLINDAAKWDYDTGNLTEQGQLTMVIDKESYNSALEEIQKVAEQKEKLLERFRNDANYGQQAYDEDLKELTSKQMGYLSDAKSALESFTKTVETTAQKQLEALNKVIDKRKEALQKQQEMHNYDKQLKNSNKEIALLEAQARALEGVSDAESKAMKARIDAQIQQKREAQQDTIREHSVNLQTEGLGDLQNQMQENYERWSQQFEANSQQQLAVMQNTQMTTQQMSTTMNNMLSAFGTNMDQLGINVSSVNAATTAAVTGMTGSFNAFTQDTSYYENALAANQVKQDQETASWMGPISDTLVDKLATAWTGETSAGEATIIENMMLDKTGDTMVENLATLDETANALPGQVGEYSNAEIDALDSNIGTVTADMASQANYIANSSGDVATAVNTARDAICIHIQQVIDAIGQAAATTINTTTTRTGVGAKNGSKNNSKKGKNNNKKSSAKSSSNNKNKTKKQGSKKKKVGTMSINKDDIYMTQENGGEIITTKEGVLIPLKAGDGVIPAQLTEKLFELAREYPETPSVGQVEIPNLTSSGTKQNVTVTYGSLLTVNGNVDKEILPSLKTILQESYQYTQKKLAQDAQKAGMRKRY